MTKRVKMTLWQWRNSFFEVNFYSLASRNKYCSSTGVLIAFDKSNPSKEPHSQCHIGCSLSSLEKSQYRSTDRRCGSEGSSRCKPTHKHLHYEGNLDVVCRALNLGQNNFASAEIQGWMDWIIRCWTTMEVFAREHPDFYVEEGLKIVIGK
jgi:hypothetical protein